MGCTVAALQLNERGYQIAWVGDSRIYLWNGTLQQLSKDHSYVQRLVDAGVIAPGDAHTHPQRNIITQALGGQEFGPLRVDSVTGRFNHDDLFMLCSDGLTGEVTDSQIVELLSAQSSLQEKADRLVQAALDHGGADNITVVLVKIPSRKKSKTQPVKISESQRSTRPAPSLLQALLSPLRTWLP